mmetsp:Transcript_15743/g.48930  ORF Transcript_15743/g.48930 Transcript_15743/m.48930 type:complete len:246 (+) Transcript_15743:361-1098(+)
MPAATASCSHAVMAASLSPRCLAASSASSSALPPSAQRAMLSLLSSNRARSSSRRATPSAPPSSSGAATRRISSACASPQAPATSSADDATAMPPRPPRYASNCARAASIQARGTPPTDASCASIAASLAHTGAVRPSISRTAASRARGQAAPPRMCPSAGGACSATKAAHWGKPRHSSCDAKAACTAAAAAVRATVTGSAPHAVSAPKAAQLRRWSSALATCPSGQSMRPSALPLVGSPAVPAS